jgi:PAS domain S-box-containing protein
MNRSVQKEKISLVRQIINNSTDGILSLNQHAIIDSINPAVCQILKCTTEHMIGQEAVILFFHDDQEK